MSKNKLCLKVWSIPFFILLSLIYKGQTKYLDCAANYKENISLILNLPSVTTISSTSLVVNCEYTPELIKGWASDKVIDAMGVIWSADSDDIKTTFMRCNIPSNFGNSEWKVYVEYIRSMKDLNIMHKIDNSRAYYDSHEGLFNEGTNKKFTMSVAPSRGISFVIGDSGAVCIDAVNNPTDTKTFRSDVLKPGTKYYIRAFVLYHPGNGWASRYDCIYSPIQSFTTASANLVNNNYLYFPKKTLVCSSATIEPIRGTNVSVSTGTYNYVWESSNGNDNWTLLNGAKSYSYAPVYPTGITSPTTIWYRRKVSPDGIPSVSSISAPVSYLFVPPSYSCDPVYDGDLNPYLAVKIGTQTWLTQDLETTRFMDGVSITKATDWNAWTSAAKPCYYNPSSYFGQIYNKYVVSENKNVCPAGYKIPSDDEWTVLSSNSSISLASTKAGWTAINGQAATNTTGFSAVPAGYVDATTGSLTLRNQNGEVVWWSDNPIPTDWFIERGYSVLTKSQLSGANGFYIRCIKR